MSNYRKTTMRFAWLAMLLCGQFLIVNTGFGFFPSTNPDLVVVHLITHGGSHRFSLPFHPNNPNDPNRWSAVTLALAIGGLNNYYVELRSHKDPSVAYNIEFTNSESEPRPFSFFADFPIRPLFANSTWGELNIELIDANGDGHTSLKGDNENGAIQQARLYNSTNLTEEPIGSSLGNDIMSAGIHSFLLEPISGPTPPDGDMLGLSTRLTLSPGDAVRITSRFIIDEGTGIPFAEIPELPDPADGPYFNVIEIDSPDTSFGDDYFIGSQTQLNLSAGGSIGERFNFHAFMNNQLNDNNFDVEVNITGGTVGHQFMALGGTTVNISGGTVNGIFLAGSYTGQSTDVEVNISGGSVARGHLAVTKPTAAASPTSPAEWSAV